MLVWSKVAGQLITATALTSLSFHLLFARRDAAELRARYTARISILESLILRLNQGEQIKPSEIDRLTKLGSKLQGHETDDLGDSEHGRESLSWKEVILGVARKEEKDVSPEDRAAREWKRALEVDSPGKYPREP